MDFTIKRRRGSKSITLRVLPGGTVSVNAPHWVSTSAIQAFIRAKQTWLTSKVALMQNVPIPKSKSQTKAEYSKLKTQALHLATSRLEHYNSFYHFTYKRVSVRNQSSRWGSCSRSQTLSFNYRIALLEPELRDYIIVHELCHLKEPNHGPNFWAEVAKTFPNHKKLRTILRIKHLNLL